MSEVLNELRECALASTRSRALAAVEGCMRRCCESMALVWIEEELDAAGKAGFLACMGCMCDSLVPYVGGCLQQIYGTTKAELDAAAVCMCLREQLELEAKAVADRAREEEERKRAEAAEAERSAAAAAAAQRKAEVGGSAVLCCLLFGYRLVSPFLFWKGHVLWWVPQTH